MQQNMQQNMQQSSIALPEIKLVGLSARTSYSQEVNAKTGLILPLIQRYFQEKIGEKVSHRAKPGTTFCVYTDYESDYRGAYTYFIGEEVTSYSSAVLAELQTLTIEAQHYAKFTTAPAPMPAVIIDAWNSIWKMGPEELKGKRRYLADFEVYDERAANSQNMVLDLYVGIER